MKHLKITFLLIVVVMIACSTNKKATSTSGELENGVQLENALLWKLSGKGINKPSYIYGTIHMIPAESYFLPKGTLTAIENCDEMFFEIDMKDMSDISSLMGMMDKIFMKNGKTLKSLLSEKDYKMVNDHFTKMGLPMFMLERIKPMFLSVFASGDISPTSMQDGKIKSYEMEFYEIAKDKKMETGGLETIEFQISVFDSIPYTEQAEMLVESLKAQKGENDEFKVMVDLYKAQDLNGMVKLMSEGSSDLGQHEDLLLNGRNKKWIPAMIEQSKKKATFFAVGAGHLGGPKGVLNLLRKEGYSVTAVK